MVSLGSVVGGFGVRGEFGVMVGEFGVCGQFGDTVAPPGRDMGRFSSPGSGGAPIPAGISKPFFSVDVAQGWNLQCWARWALRAFPS